MLLLSPAVNGYNTVPTGRKHFSLKVTPPVTDQSVICQAPRLIATWDQNVSAISPTPAETMSVQWSPFGQGAIIIRLSEQNLRKKKMRKQK
ncbi:hypothetical protein BgiMline_013073, partial [Biomphalaria glabrata]